MIDFMHLFKREGNASVEPKKELKKETGISGGTYTSNIVYVNNGRQAMCIAAVYRAVNLISSSAAVLTLQYKRKDRAKNYFKMYNTGTGATMNYLLSIRPNGRMNAYTLVKYLVAQLLLLGNAFVLPRRNAMGEVVELVLLSPHSVSYDVYTNTYTVNDLVNSVSMQSVSADDILHFKNMCADGGYWGVSTIEYARQTMNISATGNAEVLKRFATGGRLKAILQDSGSSVKGFGNYQDEQLKKMGADIQEDINSGADILVMHGDGTLTPISMSSADMQFIEAMKMNLRDIARIFNVPPSKLMDDTNANYKSAEMSNVAFYAEALQPIITEIEREFNAKMLSVKTYMDYKFIFDLKPLYSLDVESRGKADMSRLGTGQATVNDIRRENDMEPVEKGDVVYISTNLAELGSDKLSGGGVPTGESKSGDTSPEGSDE